MAFFSELTGQFGHVINCHTLVKRLNKVLPQSQHLELTKEGIMVALIIINIEIEHLRLE